MSQPHRTVSVVDAGADPTGVTDSTAIIHAGSWHAPRIGKDNLLMGVSNLWIKSSHPRPSHVSSEAPRPGQDGMHQNIGGILLHTELGDTPPEPDGSHRIEINHETLN